VNTDNLEYGRKIISTTYRLTHGGDDLVVNQLRMGGLKYGMVVVACYVNFWLEYGNMERRSPVQG
jgi:hypothetical protein